jgi:hypothetical protein
METVGFNIPMEIASVSREALATSSTNPATANRRRVDEVKEDLSSAQRITGNTMALSTTRLKR